MTFFYLRKKHSFTRIFQNICKITSRLLDIAMTKKTPNNDKHDTFLRYMKERTQYAERHKKTN